ncbi:MAG: glycosyltransferase [Nocardioidaceae bacterium]|nr:glycosyltransferase [Nocardioidaceae bacterium]
MCGRSRPTVVAIVPCLDEDATVASVVADLIAAVPDITVYVYDNGSTDRTVDVAGAAGAVVRHESRRGKGHVIRRAFGDVQADVFVIVDGDGTYDVSTLPMMIDLLHAGPYDQVVGVRRESDPSAYRRGHSAGNMFFNRVVGSIFGEPVQDMLSGFRVLSKRFVKSFPVRSRGFEVETELTVHAVGLRVPTVHVDVAFRDRPPGSESKLRTYHDGLRILNLIVRLARYERPQPFHAAIAAVLGVLSVVLGLPVILEYFDTGLVRRFPTAILASSIAIIAVLALVMGMLLEANRRVRDEGARLAYLRLPPPGHP